MLAGYLRGAGFDVHACDELSVPSAFAAIVLIGDREGSGEALDQVRAWLKVAHPARVIVVTPKPTALKTLAAVHAGRLVVLAAPAFGWDVVDALRVAEPPKPRGA